MYYSFDRNKTLYVLTNPNTLHGKHMEKDQKVAITIADSPQKPTSKKIGLQGYGVATLLEGNSKVMHALSLWRKTIDVTSDAYTYAGMMKKLITGRVYSIELTKTKLFDESRWREGEEPIVNWA